MFFDSHAHLHDAKFERDIERVLDRARVAGVTRVITLGDNLASSRRAFSLSQRAPEVLAAVGVHPHAAAEWNGDSEKVLRELADSRRVVAIGEIGLDYHHHKFGHDKQRDVFRRQLAIARDLHLPVSMHCRESYADLIEDLRTERGPEIGGVCHCFSGTLADARAFVEMGFVLGVGGTITYPNAGELRDVIKAIGIQHIILETDAPYLAPQSKRGRRNEPANLPIAAKALAQLLGETYRDVARVTTYNTERAFKLSRDHAPESVYVIANQIHVNLTNLCTNNCDFCLRHGDGYYRGHKVRLDSAPHVEEIMRLAFQDGYEVYHELVFSGLGESFFRLEEIVRIATAAKEKGKRTIVQTNGQGLLLHGPELWTKLGNSIDEFSVSLNAPDRDTYNALCHPGDPEHAFPAVLEFVRQARDRGFKVVLTAMKLPEVDLGATRALAAELGLPLQVHTREPIFEEEVLRT